VDASTFGGRAFDAFTLPRATDRISTGVEALPSVVEAFRAQDIIVERV